jgi:alpha-1,2-mannosyltransferase
MGNWRSPGAVSWRWPSWRLGGTPNRSFWLRLGWGVCCALAAGALALSTWRLLGHAHYRIDVDVYRMGAQAWLDGRPLYADNAMFHTRAGIDLPFTYPPVAAIVFCPFAWLPLPVGSAAITLITLLLLIVSTVIVLRRLDVWESSGLIGGPAWTRRCWLAVAAVAPAVIYLEPITSNFSFGQINVVLMTLVIADCVPRRTPWPRGVLLGLAIALKLTPAVFLVYFALRRDGRAALTAVASFVVATLMGFALAWSDSLQYWTNTVRNTSRIGTPNFNTNQNLAGTLARVGLSGDEHLTLWMLGCLTVLAATVWAARRLLRSGETVLALMCVAMFGLVVSPVSWSHHWVWALPTVLVTAVAAYRRRSVLLAAVGAAGVAITVWTPIGLMPEHHEQAASLWRQLVGASYVWWALVTIVVAGGAVTGRPAERRDAALDGAAVPVVG